MSLLSEDATLWADGGGKARTAVLRPIVRREAVARFWPENYCATFEEVNGQAALVVRDGREAFAVLIVDVEQGEVKTIRIFVNPEKLTRI